MLVWLALGLQPLLCHSLFVVSRVFLSASLLWSPAAQQRQGREKSLQE